MSSGPSARVHVLEISKPILLQGRNQAFYTDVGALVPAARFHRLIRTVYLLRCDYTMEYGVFVFAANLHTLNDETSEQSKRSAGFLRDKLHVREAAPFSRLLTIQWPMLRFHTK
jgi:hypothetical protein